MNFIELIIWFYVAMLLTVIAHELGHIGKRIKILRWFPWVEGASYEVRFPYGGLAVNFGIGLAVFLMQPEHIFWQILGFLNWAHFSLYAIFGSFNHEPKVPRYLWKYFIFDDVPNKLWYIFVPMGIFNFILYKDYYLPLMLDLLKSAI